MPGHEKHPKGWISVQLLGGSSEVGFFILAPVVWDGALGDANQAVVCSNVPTEPLVANWGMLGTEFTKLRMVLD